MTGSPSRDIINESRKYHDYLTGNKKSHKILPITGSLFIWQTFLFEHYDIIPKINNPYDETHDRIIINPLREGRERKWSDDLVNDVLNTFKTIPSILIGNLPLNNSPIPQTFGNIEESLKLIMTSKYYIGGETGLSLFAGITDKSPEKLALIYGPKQRVEYYKNRFRNVAKEIFKQTDRKISEKDIYLSYFPQTKKSMYIGYNDKTNGKSLYNYFNMEAKLEK